jgi:hypothetical protein
MISSKIIFIFKKNYLNMTTIIKNIINIGLLAVYSTKVFAADCASSEEDICSELASMQIKPLVTEPRDGAKNPKAEIEIRDFIPHPHTLLAPHLLKPKALREVRDTTKTKRKTRIDELDRTSTPEIKLKEPERTITPDMSCKKHRGTKKF